MIGAACRALIGAGMRSVTLDDFADVRAWEAVASGLATLDLTPDVGPNGGSLRLDFDFKGGGGFVVARRVLTQAMPEAWAIRWTARGAAPANRFELKLVDPSGRNVWWRQWDALDLPSDWHEVVVSSREVEFGYGPAGGGALEQLGAIEFAIAAGPGGAGTLWLADLRLDDRTYRRTPHARASSAAAGHSAAHALDGDPATSWRSDDTPGPHHLEIDFGEVREYGGLDVHWVVDAKPRRFRVETSDDGYAWRVVHEADAPDGARSRVPLAAAVSRYLRLVLETTAAAAVRDLVVESFEVSRSVHAFFAHVARDEALGHNPRWLAREQSYWTPIGIPDGTTCAIMNEEGMVEPDRGTWSLEPFLHDGTRLLAWADAAVTQTLEDGWMPIPSSIRDHDALRLVTTAYAARRGGRPVLYVRYRVTGTSPSGRVRLLVGIRPFQVNPPWQEFGELGGMRRIATLACDGSNENSGEVSDDGAGSSDAAKRGDGLRVDGTRVVVPLQRPVAFGAAAFEHGTLTSYLARGDVPPRSEVTDAFGYASGAFAFDLAVDPVAPTDVYLVVPFEPTDEPAARWLDGPSGGAAFDDTVGLWRQRLGPPRLIVPPSVGNHADAIRTAAAHVLVNRDGAALQPGPRRYTRSWIRDGAIMAAALLRAGERDAATEFVRWYATYQGSDGNVPCCVDRGGPDWLEEHDSHGELIWVVMECFRFTGDRGFLAELLPAVRGAIEHLDRLRAARLAPEFANRACYGLLPESASHEGYLAHPVHSYWDDFWALAGYRDAAAMAAILGNEVESRRLAAIHDAFRSAVRASVARTIAERDIAYVPGSVEWADFDPTATANTVALLDYLEVLPRRALERTFDQYLEGFRRRVRGEVDWNNYSAYEVRIVGALVRLGRRDDAAELLAFLMKDRRPCVWNQWPEITWRNPRSPGHLGDVPHTWIGAEYVLAVRSVLVDEHPSDGALVLAAGVPGQWLDDGGVVGVDAMPTHYGSLDFRLRREVDGALVATIGGGLVVPPGGVVLRPPLVHPLANVEINGAASSEFDAESATIRVLPAEVCLR